MRIIGECFRSSLALRLRLSAGGSLVCTALSSKGLWSEVLTLLTFVFTQFLTPSVSAQSPSSLTSAAGGYPAANVFGMDQGMMGSGMIEPSSSGWGNSSGAQNQSSQIVPLGARLGGASTAESNSDASFVPYFGEESAGQYQQKESMSLNEEAPPEVCDYGFEQELVGTRAGRDAMAFYTKGSALSTYQQPAQLTKKPCARILNGEIPKTKIPKESKRQQQAPPSAQTAKKELSKEEQILKDFGDPSLESPILATAPDAPKPLQAMFAALEVGNDELAFKYARQYARFMRNLQDRSRRIAELTDIGQQWEGLKPRSEIPEGADYEGTKYLLENALKQQEEQYRSVEKRLDPEVHRLLKLAESEEDRRVAEMRGESNVGDRSVANQGDGVGIQDFSSPASGSDPSAISKVSGVSDEAHERALVREEFIGKVPSNPSGRLTVYFFVRSTDSESFRMMENFLSVAEEFKENRAILFKALLANRGGDEDFIAVARGLKGKVEIASGAEMARRLGIRRTPSIFFYIPGEDRTRIEEGVVSKARLSELVRLWSGMSTELVGGGNEE